ncbi:MAG: hypothetical protein ACI9JY_001903 [Saprospiraceae bacterium]|jgi:uncharacterized protein (DUF1501 family)
MKRRNFLKTASTGVIGLPLTVQGMNIGVLPKSQYLNNLSLTTDKVLVLITQSGGNDGLNMVIPVDQYSTLSTHRSNVLIPEASVLSLTPETGLHPAMSSLHSMFVNDGQVALIQAVGYPNPNRSHFRSTDIIQSASDSNVNLLTGYLGRYLDTEVSNYPTGYPDATNPDPFAMVIGNNVSKTCQGAVANYSLAIANPFNLNPLATGAGSTPPPGYYGDRLSYVRTTFSQTNDYAATIEAAANSGNNIAIYPSSSLANKLKIIANLISGGLQTRIFVVSQGGYDTHSGQVDNGNTASGNHASLLGDLSDSIAAFQNDLNQLNIADKVLGLTYSEFGRRIKSNGNNGTDHGDAGPMIIFGTNVNPGIHGVNPTIPVTVTNSQAIPMQFDFREVYQGIIEGWFCSPTNTIQNDILMGSFVDMGAVAGPCSSNVLPIELITFEAEAGKQDISLLWTVGEISGFKGFQIQRSENGVNFKDHSWLISKGDTVKNYSSVDRDVEDGQRYYYRLKMVDMDDTFTISSIKTAIIERSEEMSITVYPNPANHQIHIQTTQEFDEAHIFILSKTGEPVYDNENWNGDNLSIKISHLPAGLYTVQAVVRRQVTIKKFLKM